MLNIKLLWGKTRNPKIDEVRAQHRPAIGVVQEPSAKELDSVDVPESATEMQSSCISRMRHRWLMLSRGSGYAARNQSNVFLLWHNIKGWNKKVKQWKGTNFILSYLPKQSYQLWETTLLNSNISIQQWFYNHFSESFKNRKFSYFSRFRYTSIFFKFVTLFIGF